MSAFNARCNDALLAADQMANHIYSVHQAVLLATKNIPSPDLLSSHTLKHVVSSFMEQTSEIPLFKNEPEKLLEFVKFKISLSKDTIVVLSEIRIPLEIQTYELFSFLPATNLVENQFCTLKTMDNLILSKTKYIGQLTKTQEKNCEVYNKLTLCVEGAILIAPTEKNCAQTVMQNSTTDLEFATECNIRCFNSEYNQVN